MDSRGADGLEIVFWLIVFLAAYEAVRAVVAFRKHEKITKDAVAAVVLGGVVVLVLYVQHKYF